MDILVSFLPVVIFLLFLLYLDSFKLVKKNDVFTSFFWGVFSASSAYYIITTVIKNSTLSVHTYSQFIAPVVEECLKAVFLILMIRKNKIGFIIDGAILGFSIGTGFAFMENLYYLHTLETTNMAIWIVRGFGTAVMHGGTTAIAAIIIMRSADDTKRSLAVTAKALLAAILLHSIYNQFWVSPVLSAMIIFITLPLLLNAVFRQSESSLRQWLEIEFDSEVSILRMIRTGLFSETRSGKYISSLKEKFAPDIIVDILCYIRIYLELSLKAKSNMMLKEAGFPVNKDKEIKEKLTELEYIKKHIGKTGLLAISPVLRMNRNDLWKFGQLQ